MGSQESQLSQLFIFSSFFFFSFNFSFSLILFFNLSKYRMAKANKAILSVTCLILVVSSFVDGRNLKIRARDQDCLPLGHGCSAPGCCEKLGCCQGEVEAECDGYWGKCVAVQDTGVTRACCNGKYAFCEETDKICIPTSMRGVNWKTKK